ncbi:hypothetical protein ACF1BQ_005635 [Bradyrhizobium sp. RDT10]
MPERVVIINDLSEQRGGATNVALQSAALLDGAGIPVTYFTGDRGAHSDLRLRKADVVAVGGEHILRMPRPRAMLHGLYNASAGQRLADWIAANDTPGTVYHLHGWSKILSPSVFYALRPVARRLFVSAHDFFLVCPNGGYFDFRKESPCDLRPMSTSCVLRSCDRRNYAHKLWRSARQEVRRAAFDFVSTGAKVLAVHEGMLPHLERGEFHGPGSRRYATPSRRGTLGASKPNRTRHFCLSADSKKIKASISSWPQPAMRRCRYA